MPSNLSADDAAWVKSWEREVARIPGDITYVESAEHLRKLMKTGLLKFTDIYQNPERYFLAHRIVAEQAPRTGPGFFIRFTVQYNLFAGTVVGLGGPEQLAALEDIRQKGELGCFGLTEKLAGVNSGLVALTTAVWDEQEQVFILRSADTGAAKNWISQGITAEKSVAVADLWIEGKSYGPHAFLIDFRKGGQLAPGIVIGDMGQKTVGNDLDNAWIEFRDVRVPKAALLNRYSDIVDGKYVQKQKGLRTMDMLGQRLFTGRVAVAQAALTFGKRLFAMTKEHSDKKLCWSPSGNVPLSNIPQLKAIFKRGDMEFAKIDAYVNTIEAQLNKNLRDGTLPNTRLMDAIAVAKVKAVETTIQLCFALKQEVGSYALMGGAGFEQMDFLQACKFAEGDSRILMQKLARDRVRNKSPPAHSSGGKAEAEQQLANELKAVMALGSVAWDENFEKVYQLADMIIDRTVNSYVPVARM